MKEQIGQLFVEAGHAHHEAFIETDGADPEWPMWYANYLQAKLSAALGTELTQSEIVYWVIKLDKDYRAASPDEPWPTWYAQVLLENCG